MTKQELSELVLTKEELNQIDFALPQNFVDDCNNLLNVDPRHYYVWMYSKDCPVIGKPFNLLERFFKIYQTAQGLLDDANKVYWECEKAGFAFKEGIQNDDPFGLKEEFYLLSVEMDKIFSKSPLDR